MKVKAYRKIPFGSLAVFRREGLCQVTSADGDIQFITSVRVRDMRSPPVPSKRVRCEGGCRSWLWLSFVVLTAIPDGTVPLCLDCVDAVARDRGLKWRPVIPDAVVDEYREYAKAGWHGSN